MYEIEQKDRAGDYDFIPMGTVALGVQAKGQKAMQFIQAVSNPMWLPYVNMPLLLRLAYDAVGLPYGDSIIASPQQMQQQMAVHQQQMQAGQGAQGNPSPPKIEGPNATQPGQQLALPGGMGG